MGWIIAFQCAANQHSFGEARTSPGDGCQGRTLHRSLGVCVRPVSVTTPLLCLGRWNLLKAKDLIVLLGLLLAGLLHSLMIPALFLPT